MAFLKWVKSLLGIKTKAEREWATLQAALEDYYLPLSMLLEALQRNGFKIGVDTYVQVHQLLQRCLTADEAHQLSYWLCPLLASSEEEQKLFYELFAQYLQAARKPVSSEPQKEASSQKEKNNKRKDPEKRPSPEEQDTNSEGKSTTTPAEKQRVVASMQAHKPQMQVFNRFIAEVPVLPDTLSLRMARQLRFMRPVDRYELDIPATVERAIQQMGHAQPQWRARQQHVSYLLLIEEGYLQNHQARLHDELYQLFLANTIPAYRYFFHATPLVCHNERHPGGLELRQLRHRHKEAILLIFADGKQFINSRYGRMLGWSEQLRHWSQRFFFSNHTPLIWSRREQILDRFFTAVLPASPEGLQALAAQLDQSISYQNQNLRFWVEHADYTLQEIKTEGKTLDFIEMFFRPEIKKWIAACALYPELNWGLTLLLGQHLSTPDHKLCSYLQIRQLLRLDWFRQGKIPDVFKVALYQQWLDASERQQIHRWIYSALKKQPTEDANHLLQMAIHELLSLADAQERRAAAEKLKKLLAQTQQRPDWVTLHLINESNFIEGLYFDIPDAILKEWGIEPKIKTLPFEPKTLFIKGGIFKMGATKEQGDDAFDDEKPAHLVTVKDFNMGIYPVTVAEFAAFVKATDYDIDDGWQKNVNNEAYEVPLKENRYPVIRVNWHDAKAYCAWLREETGKNYRLPSEAEWEYAARGGQKSEGFKYAGSDDLNKVGWYDENSENRTHIVGEKKDGANELDLYDMSGNVWEWCEDDWHSSYENNPPKDGKPWIDDPDNRAGYRVIRGGSWNYDARYCRVSDRYYGTPSHRYSLIGFRVVVGPLV